MHFPGRILCLHAAARRLGIPERTLRYRASRGRIAGAFKKGKLWKFPAEALESAPSLSSASLRLGGESPAAGLIR